MNLSGEITVCSHLKLTRAKTFSEKQAVTLFIVAGIKRFVQIKRFCQFVNTTRRELSENKMHWFVLETSHEFYGRNNLLIAFSISQNKKSGNPKHNKINFLW